MDNNKLANTILAVLIIASIAASFVNKDVSATLLIIAVFTFLVFDSKKGG